MPLNLIEGSKFRYHRAKGFSSLFAADDDVVEQSRGNTLRRRAIKGRPIKIHPSVKIVVIVMSEPNYRIGGISR
jgi:hypothetical protein